MGFCRYSLRYVKQAELAEKIVQDTFVAFWKKNIKLQGLSAAKVYLYKAVYTYYQGMLELMMNDGGLMGPLPANPPTNISGGALGVFQANSILESSILME